MNSVDNCEVMPQVRADFHAIITESELEAFFKLAETVNCEKKTPYVATSVMRQAEFAFWPFKKLSYFREGKKMLEAYIEANPNDIEGHYVRLLAQLNAPGFLNYNHNIVEDRNFINAHLDSSDLPEAFKKKMLHSIEKHSNK